MYFSTLPRSLPSQNTPYIQNASQKGDEKGGENRSAAALPAPASRTYMASQKAYVVPNVTLIRGNRNNRRHPPPAHGCCERVARERGFPRAGGTARGQKAECTRALRPRVKPLPYLIRRRLNAGRSNVKKQYKRLRFSPTPKKGCGEKRRGFSPRGAKRPRGRFPTGNRAGRGMAGISHAKALHQITKPGW